MCSSRDICNILVGDVTAEGEVAGSILSSSCSLSVDNPEQHLLYDWALDQRDRQGSSLCCCPVCG